MKEKTVKRIKKRMEELVKKGLIEPDAKLSIPFDKELPKGISIPITVAKKGGMRFIVDIISE